MRTALALVAALLAVVAGAWILDDVIFGDDIARNTEVAGVDLGGSNRAEATATVQATLDGPAGLDDTPVTLVWEGLSADFTTTELGVGVDAEATVDEAADRGSLLTRPLRWFGSLFVARSVEPVLTVDTDVLGSVFATGPEAAFDLGLDDAGIELIDGSFVADGPATVPAPDVDAVAEELLAALAEHDGETPIELVVPTTDEELVIATPELIDEINALTAAGIGIVVVGDAEPRPVDAATLRSWIVFEGSTGTGELSIDDIALDDELVGAHLADLFADIGEEGQEASFEIDFLGGVQIVGGAPGSTCCQPDSADRILAALRAGNERAVLRPVEAPDARGIEWAESLGITEVVGEFTTNYTAGQSRNVNIERISELTRGVVIEPGQTFSVNDFVGRRTTENGFVSAGVIANGVFKESVGGGISQYATTLFNAAFFAGLDFGEYQSHSIYISRYPYGREATVSFPHPDLQIRNTTPYGGLLWPTTTADSITVRLYSTPWVRGEQTAQTERTEGVACTRVTTTRTRTWLEDGRTENDTVTARYRPEGIACDGSSTVPTTTTTTTTTVPPTEPVDPPPEEPVDPPADSSTTTTTTTTTAAEPPAEPVDPPPDPPAEPPAE